MKPVYRITSSIAPIFLLSLTLQLSSCSKTAQSSTSDDKFDGKELILGAFESRTTLAFTDVYQRLSVIPLETKEDCLVGTVNKIIFNDQHIIVLNNRNTLFIFNKRGDFINKIVAAGPGGVTAISDVVLAGNDSTFYFINNRTQNVVEANFKGEIRRRFDIPFKAVLSLATTPTGDILIFSPFSTEKNTEGRPNLVNNLTFLSTTTGEIIKSIIHPVSSKIPPIVQAASFTGAGKYFSIKTPYSDTIYGLTKNYNLKPRLLLKAPGKKIGHERDLKTTVALNRKSKPLFFEHFLEKGDFIFLRYQQGSRSFKVVIDKVNDTYHNLDFRDNILSQLYNVSGLGFGTGEKVLRFFPTYSTTDQTGKSRELMFVSAPLFLQYRKKAQGIFPTYFKLSNAKHLPGLTDISNPVLLIAD